jgi:hypothetical protein
MQESKEIGPHITTKEELDALYRKTPVATAEDKNTDILSENQEK